MAAPARLAARKRHVEDHARIPFSYAARNLLYTLYEPAAEHCVQRANRDIWRSFEAARDSRNEIPSKIRALHDKPPLVIVDSMRILTSILCAVLLVGSVTARADDSIFRFWKSNAAAEGSEAAQAEKPAEGSINRVINQALDMIGIDYRYGSATPEKGLDCSGLVKYVFEQSLNIAMPHNALAMSKIGDKISRTDLKPGDLVFFNTLRRSMSHVGIYIGDGKFVHAPRTGKKVQVVDLNDKYWSSHYEGARRIVAGQSAPDVPQE